MSRRPTIADVAREAGVGVATVDRVLNGRLPVKEDTARRVHEAATRLGYHAAALIGQRVRRAGPPMRLGFLLLRLNDAFYQAFAKEIDVAAGQAGAPVVTAIDFAETLAPDEIAARAGRLAERCDALALVSPDHPTLTAAIADLRHRGIPVVSLLSDFAAGVREAYIGVDNLKVGRTAAWAIANCAAAPGKVALVVGSHRFHGHELREIGFRAFFREHAPEFTVMETLVNHESHALTHDALAPLFAAPGGLAGCYVAGGGAEGAVSALRQVRPHPLPAIVCNEITPDRRAALAEGLLTMVIGTPLAALCRSLIERMAGPAVGEAAGGSAQIFLPFDIFIPENI